jgi:hypothetical protein
MSSFLLATSGVERMTITELRVSHDSEFCFACFHLGHSKQAPAKSYSVEGSSVSKMFTIFNSLAIIITTFGNGIIPEIQVWIRSRNSGKVSVRFSRGECVPWL